MSNSCHYKIPDAVICFQIINPVRLLVPLVIVTMKRNEDIFLSFSKIESLDQVINFNVIKKKRSQIENIVNS